MMLGGYMNDKNDKWEELSKIKSCEEKDLIIAEGFFERQANREKLYALKERLQTLDGEWFRKSYDI